MDFLRTEQSQLVLKIYSQNVFKFSLMLQYFNKIAIYMNLSRNLTYSSTQTQDHTFQKMKQLLSEGLYGIEPTLKHLTKNHLGILSVPGVAKVCTAINKQPKLIDTYSMRATSVAIVSRGKMFGGYGRYFLPIMDWFVVQIKVYANIDCYPFVIRSEAPLQNVLQDLSNSYCGVIFLDQEQIPKISPSLNFFVLRHWDACKFFTCQFTNAEYSSYVLAQLIKNNFEGTCSQVNLSQINILEKHKLNQKKIDQEIINQNLIIKKCPLQVHQNLKGKIMITVKYTNIEQLKKYFTQKNLKRLIKQKDYKKSLTSKLNAIVTDGTAILGLGNIGPISGLPVMEAKSMMFKLLGDVNIVPLCINTRKNPTQTVNAILDLVHLYKAVNLEDIKAPQCFSIQRKIQNMDILPVFHDDQHGTAIAALAGLINSVKLVQKNINQCKVVINGAGAAGISIAHILHEYGVNNITICDTSGVIYKGREQNMNEFKAQIAQITNQEGTRGTLKDVIIGADVFIGVSSQGTFNKNWIKLMNVRPIIFAMANPNPEISMEQALEGGCFIYGSGKSNMPNQITNSLAYPGIFRAVNQHNIRKITDSMKIQAAKQIALIKGNDATPESILPYSLSKNISIRISQKLKQFS